LASVEDTQGRTPISSLSEPGTVWWGAMCTNLKGKSTGRFGAWPLQDRATAITSIAPDRARVSAWNSWRRSGSRVG